MAYAASGAMHVPLAGLANPGGEAPPITGDDPRRKYEQVLKALEGWSAYCQKWDDKRLKEYREGRFGRESGDGVSANNRFAFVTMLMAYLMAQAPAIEVEPRDTDGGGSEVFVKLAMLGLVPNPDEGRRLFADGFEQLLTHSYEESGCELPNRVALFRALVVGAGFTKVGWDAERGLDRIDAVERQDFYADPEAKYALSDGKYVVQTCAWNFERAEAFFKAKLNVSIEANFQLAEASGLMGKAQREHAPPTEKPDMYRFHEMWCKEGDKRLLYYYEARTRRLLGEPIPWPFELDSDDFAFDVLTFNTQYLQALDGFGELEVVAGLQDLHEDGMAYQAKHVARSRAKKILYNSSKINPEQVTQLQDAKDMRFVGIEAGDDDLRKHIVVQDFNSNTDADLERTGIFKREADEISGQDELVRGAQTQTKMTATEAAVKDANSKLRSGRRTKLLDEFLTSQTKKRAMVARQLVSPEKVAAIAGQRQALIWSVYAPNPQDLKCGYSIGITAGSTSEQHKRERIERIDRFLELGNKINAAYAAPVVNLIELAKDRQKIDGFRRVDKYFNAALVAQITAPPAPMQAPGPAGAVPAPAIQPSQQQQPSPQAPNGVPPVPEGGPPA